MENPDNKSNLPLISVIIPCYNQAHFLAQAIDSVLAQTYSHFEIIVINDGSPDNIQEVMLPYLSDPRIILHNQANQGLSNARNTGIKLAQGQFFQFLDSDDWITPSKFDLQVNQLLADPSAAFSYCNFFYYYEDTDQLEEMPGEKIAFFEEDPLTAFWTHSIFPPASIVIRREWVERTGEFRAGLPVAEDYDYWLRAVALGARARYLDVPLAFYRRHSQNLTTTTKGTNLEDTFIKIRAYFVKEFPQEAARASFLAFNRLNQTIHKLEWELKGVTEELVSAKGQIAQKEADLESLQLAYEQLNADSKYHYEQLESYLEQQEKKFKGVEEYALSLKNELDKVEEYALSLRVELDKVEEYALSLRKELDKQES